MSVLNRGMKMPKCCMDCPCFRSTILDDEQWCGAMRKGLGKYFKQCIALKKRHDDCPLVEIPTLHGRLIDADALKLAIVVKGKANGRGKYRIGDIWELTGSEIREVIDRQPTIIKAEGSEE